MANFSDKPLMNTSDVFTKEELEGIKKAVADAELLTSGEIVVAVISKCHRGLTTKEQALRDFYRLGLDKTQDKTGILILIILQLKAIEVLADKGINDIVPEGYWSKVVEIISNSFKEGKPYDGICQAVVKIGEILARNFPRKPNDINEIPDEVKLDE